MHEACQTCKGNSTGHRRDLMATHIDLTDDLTHDDSPKADAGSSAAHGIDLTSDFEEMSLGYDAELAELKRQHAAATQMASQLHDVVDLDEEDDTPGHSVVEPARKLQRKQLPLGAEVIDTTVVTVKLMVQGGKDAESLEFSISGDVKLVHLFSTRAVRRMLRAQYELSAAEVEQPMQLARAFELAVPRGGAGGSACAVLSGGALHASSFVDMVGQASRALIHLRRRGGGGVSKGDGRFIHSSAFSDCDEVKLVRIGRAHDGPILHIKNFGKDQGAGMLDALTIENHLNGRLQRFAAAAASLAQKVPMPSAVTNGTAQLYEAADRVLDLAEAAVLSSADPDREMAARALRGRSAYFQSAALFYEPGCTLHRHMDGIGSWLMLFQFGNTAKFFVGDKTVDFESGDVLVFKGATVMHGVDETKDHATLRGQRCALPAAVEKVTRGYRVSVQARQQ